MEKEIHMQMRNATETSKLMTTKRQPEKNCNNVESLSWTTLSKGFKYFNWEARQSNETK